MGGVDIGLTGLLILYSLQVKKSRRVLALAQELWEVVVVVVGSGLLHESFARCAYIVGSRGASQLGGLF